MFQEENPAAFAQPAGRAGILICKAFFFFFFNLNSAVHPDVKRGTAEFSICNASVFSLAGRDKMWAWEGLIQHSALLLA